MKAESKYLYVSKLRKSKLYKYVIVKKIEIAFPLGGKVVNSLEMKVFISDLECGTDSSHNLS